MKWTTERPTKAEYYWALPKDRDDWLDCSPEIVKVYFDGKWQIIRPGIGKCESFDDFVLWSDEPITMPDGDYDDCMPKD